jgi:hypothetical protein
MEILDGIAAWAWARHHNPWSWYIRPLFLLPLCYFSHRRSWGGIVLTILAIVSSMFWFPPPRQADATISEFLDFERRWLTSAWDLKKSLLTLAAPLSLFMLGWAFWRRSLYVGLVLINLMGLGKIAWSLTAGQDAGAAVIAPALVGLLVCNTAIIVYARRTRRRSNIARRADGREQEGAIARDPARRE